MSKECTEYDLKIALYHTSKGNMAVIQFFNDTEILLDCTRITLIRKEDNLYFYNGDSDKRSIKLSGRFHNVLQSNSDYSKIEDMEGFYDLKFDQTEAAYYVSKRELLCEYSHKGTGRIGLKYLNYNSGTREKRGEYTMTAILTESGKKIIESKQSKDIPVTSDDTIVRKALINLLKLQVADNNDALSTINTLENYI